MCSRTPLTRSRSSATRLQLKGAKMGDDLGRVMINTTFGLRWYL